MGRFRTWLLSRSDKTNIAWFPELRFCDTATERAALWRSCYWHWLKHKGWRYLLLLCALSAGVQIAMSLAVWGIRRGFNLHWPYLTMFTAAAAVGGAIVGLSWMVMIRRSMQQTLRAELRRRGVPVCQQCGYDLRGQVEPRCPECGTAA